MDKFNFTKPIIIFFTGLLLWIALSMVEGKVFERQQFRNQAELSVSESWTKPQTLAGPILIIPYIRSHPEKYWNKELKKYKTIVRKTSRNLYILPQQADFNINLKSETRIRGIYPVPVYHAQVNVEGMFSNQRLKKLLKDPEVQQKGSAILSFSVTDSRGIISLPVIELDKSKLDPLSGSQLPFAREGFSAEVGNKVLEQEQFNFIANFELNGMSAIDFVAVAKNQQIMLISDWPHPKFNGSFLPLTRTIEDDGYQAKWKTSQYSVDFESVIDNCVDASCVEIFDKSFGVEQINSIDVYRQSQRAVTYGILFILVTFVAFALVEILKGIRLHPIQYGLAGANLAIFFLLLLAISEHVSFARAYLLATGAVISLLFYYLRYSFKDTTLAIFVASGIAILYAILYLIIQSEDHALLAGSLLLFSLLSAVIISTRNINWHRF